MIALIRSGFFENFDARAAAVWAVVFALGVPVCLLIRKRNARLITVGVSLALLGICDLMACLPTPAWLAGDGYAVLGDVGLIGASFLAPLAAGALLSFLITEAVRLLRKA